MNRLVYLCDWLPPDFGAVGQYSLLFSRQRAAAGEEVTLGGLSSAGDSDQVETIGDGSLRTLRVRASTYDRADFLRRARWTVATNWRLIRRLWPALREADEILFTGSPPFLAHFLVPLNLLLRKRLTYRITDFHPECLMAELGRSPWPLRAFYRLTIFLRRRVHRFEVLGEDQRRRLREIGIPAERIVLKRDPAPVEIAPGTRPLPRPPELAGKVVLLYSGNFGVAHDHETLLAGYREHHRRGSGRVMLWLNATGAKADLVERLLREEDLPVHRSRPLPLDQLPALLVTPDAHLITLRDPFVGFVLPSKVYGCVASGKPVVFLGSQASDVHLVCAGSSALYLRAGVPDATGFAALLERLADHVEAGQESHRPAGPS